MLAVATAVVAATCVATELISISVKFGTTASNASTARVFVKYRFVVPSARSSVSESATPFSAANWLAIRSAKPNLTYQEIYDLLSRTSVNTKSNKVLFGATVTNRGLNAAPNTYVRLNVERFTAPATFTNVYTAYRALSIENVTVSAKRDEPSMFEVSFRLLFKERILLYVITSNSN